MYGSLWVSCVRCLHGYPWFYDMVPDYCREISKVCIYIEFLVNMCYVDDNMCYVIWIMSWMSGSNLGNEVYRNRP